MPSELIEYAKHIFDRNTSDFDTLDNKALGIIGIVGVIVALNFLKINELVEIFQKPAENCVWYSLYHIKLSLFIIHGVSAIAVFIFSLVALQIKEIDYPTDIKDLIDVWRKEKTEDLASKKLRVDIIHSYGESIKCIERLNLRKADRIKIAVISLIFSIISLAILLVISLASKL